MNILLTGLNGFFGKIVSKQISKSNIIWGLGRSGSDFNFFLEKEVPEFNVQFDLVIHAAGKAHSVSKSDFSNQNFYRINVLGTQNLLKGLNNSGIPKYFVFISSVSVYGKYSGSNIYESASLEALDPYGMSKVIAERIVLDWCNLHKVVCTILRLPLIVGPNPPGNLGDMIKGIQIGYYFNIAGGNAKKSMVLGDDVAKAILNVGMIGGIYNLTDGYNPSFEELSNHISIQLGKRKPMNMTFWMARIVAKFGDLFGDKAPINTNKLTKITSDLTFNDNKAKEAFGWNPTSVIEGFRINE